MALKPSPTAADIQMRLAPGLRGTTTLRVEDEHTAVRLGSGRAVVLATPIMIALMEAAAVECVEHLLDEGQETLGVLVDVEHLAPTPVGQSVTAEAVLSDVSGRVLNFDVVARDSGGVIGKGRHRRVVVDSSKFQAKVRAKADQD